MNQEERAAPVCWYRSRVDSETLRRLSMRNDLLASLQTGGHLALLAAFGTAAMLSIGHAPWWATLLLVYGYGFCCSFCINAVHELGHNTVFKSKAVNSFFEHIFGFLGWINFHMFSASHVRHHRYTLHPPDDLEVVVPIDFTLGGFLKQSLVNPEGLWHILRNTWRIANGRFEGEWEQKLFPESEPQKRDPAISWARILLIGHGTILLVSITLKLWLLPVLLSFGTLYGGVLFFLCNNTQHVGLLDNSTDFRLCCRTFVPNPLVRLLYWHMNYHIEHHMYVSVPCYNLGKLHRAIQADLPPSPRGILATWLEIGAILKEQRQRLQQPLPISSGEPETAG